MVSVVSMVSMVSMVEAARTRSVWIKVHRYMIRLKHRDNLVGRYLYLFVGLFVQASEDRHI